MNKTVEPLPAFLSSNPEWAKDEHPSGDTALFTGINRENHTAYEQLPQLLFIYSFNSISKKNSLRGEGLPFELAANQKR